MTGVLSYFSSLSQKLSWKLSVLEISQILGLLVNSLTANDKYSLRNSENLTQPNQMQLIQNQKTSLHSLLHF